MTITELISVGLVLACFCIALIWILFLNREDHSIFKSYLQNLREPKRFLIYNKSM